MKTELQQTLSEIEVTEPTTAGGLQIFGLRWTIKSDLSYITLDEALADESLEITEVSERGDVPTQTDGRGCL